MNKIYPYFFCFLFGVALTCVYFRNINNDKVLKENQKKEEEIKKNNDKLKEEEEKRKKIHEDTEKELNKKLTNQELVDFFINRYK